VSNEEFNKFDAVVRKVLSVSHEELLRREKEWKRKRARKKRAKNFAGFPRFRREGLESLGGPHLASEGCEG
jgi:hypothetical protein